MKMIYFLDEETEFWDRSCESVSQRWLTIKALLCRHLRHESQIIACVTCKCNL